LQNLTKRGVGCLLLFLKSILEFDIMALLLFFDIPGVSKRHLAFFFLLKATAGIGLTLIYTYYYTDQGKSDIYRFFNDSKVISLVLFEHPGAWLKIITGIGTFEPETFSYLHNTQYFSHPSGDIVTNYAFLIRIISILNYFSGYNIYIDTLLLNCITFVALIVLFKALLPYFKEFQQVLYVPLFLIPSFVFWGSGLLKEGLMLAGISLYLSARLGDRREGGVWRIFLIFLGFIIVALTKIYVAAILVISSFFIPVKTTGRQAQVAWGGRIVFAMIIGFVAFTYAGNNFCSKVIDKRNEFIALSLAEHSGSSLDTSLTTADCEHLASLVPKAMVNAIGRPYVWSGRNTFEILFALENIVFLLGLLVLLIFYLKKPVGDKLLVAMFCSSFAAFNYLVIGITVPVVGAIVHYRIVAMPFLLLAVLLFIDLDKLKRSLPFKF
jgi:hypothetical protein